MLRALLAALFVCVASPAMAQVDLYSIFQGNAYSQRGGYSPVHRGRASYGTVIGGAPAGCGHLRRLYCGCASARYVGISGARWNVNLASAWFGLSRAPAAPGMACVTRHHVKIILGSTGGGRYRFYDPNSGGGLTRITTGPLNCTVVNPHGAYRGGYAKPRKRGRR